MLSCNRRPRLGAGQQALYDIVIDALKYIALDLEARYSLLNLAVNVLGDVHSEVDGPLGEMWPLVSDLWGSQERREVVRNFVMRFTNREQKIASIHHR